MTVTDEKYRRLCLALMIFGVLVQLLGAGIDAGLLSGTGLQDSTFDRPRPELSDWPVHGE